MDKNIIVLWVVFVGEDDVGNWVFGGSEEKGFSGVGERRESGFGEVCVEEAVVVVGREKGGFGEGRRESLSCGHGHCCAKEKSEEDKVSSRFWFSVLL